MSGKKKHRSANDHLQYLKGDLSRHERYAFEKDLEADPFEQEAAEGLETLNPEQAEQDILNLHNRLRKRLSRRRRVAFYSIAATVASLLIVGTLFLKVYDFNPKSDEKQVYTEESYDKEPTSETSETSETPETFEASEAQTLEPIQREAEISEPESPSQVEDPEMPRVVSQKEIESKQEMEAVTAISAEVPEEEEITHMEAEPSASASENRVTQSGRKAAKEKRSMAQAVSEAPQVAAMEADTELALTPMLASQVSGVVISAEDQEPIPGAMVENQRSRSYVVTDIDGRFDIPVQEDSPTTLVARFIGMETLEYPVVDETDVELILKPDPIVLEEVVVVGQVSYVESTPTGSTQVVRSEKTEDTAAYTVAEPSVGYKAYKKYIEEHIQFPADETETEKAVVVLKFRITGKGKIREVSALRSPGEAFTAEAISLLKEGPPWIPASNEDGPIDDWIRMRIVFKR